MKIPQNCERCDSEIQVGHRIIIIPPDRTRYDFCGPICASRWLSYEHQGVLEWPQNEKEAKRLDGLVREFDSWFLFKTHIRTHEVCHNARSKHCEKCEEPECVLRGWKKAMEEEKIMIEQALRDQRIQDGDENDRLEKY